MHPWLTWFRCAAWLLGNLALLPLAQAQHGDRAGEAQDLLPEQVVVPPAIVRTPAEELATMTIAEGFTVQLCASEPLLEDPVAATFDAQGRMWVVEMRSYMRDVDAGGEHEPLGRIAVLSDHDVDGRMDARTTFLDGLVLPRSVLPLLGGALVIEPPQLWWCPDADGDGRADRKELVMGGFEAGLDNPEHAGNGLLWGLDQRIHLANDKRVLSVGRSGFVVEQGSGGGQWGLTQDNRGRLYFNYNEDWLRCDLVPGLSVARLGMGPLALLNHRLVKSASVWPNHLTPGVNRGYQKGRLVDYRLALHTAVCAPLVLRDAWPCAGDVLVCEPAGNVVRRVRLDNGDALPSGVNPYEAERREFLASTDERFRPVHLCAGPDQAVYLVDMYRGVIQHRNFVTSYLRDQIKKRALEQPTGLGRIWRIVPTNAPTPRMPPPLVETQLDELVRVLADASSVRRDHAMRLLVQQRAAHLAQPVRSLARTHAQAAVRMQAIATLAGLQRLTRDDLRMALRDADPGVVCLALQHAAPPCQQGDGLLWGLVQEQARQGVGCVVWHAALVYCELARALAPARRKQVLLACQELLVARSDVPQLAELFGHGLQTLTPELFARADLPVAARKALAAAVGRRRQVDELEPFFAALLPLPNAARAEALSSFLASLPKGNARVGCLRFPQTPAALAALAGNADAATASLAHEVLAAVALQPAATAAPTAAWPAAALRRLGQGERLFAAACAACHQLDGAGMAGLAPPLRESEWVSGPATRTIAIALHGVKGPIEAAGESWDREMPGQGQLGDSELADILSYVRTKFGGATALVSQDEVAAVRTAHASRKEPWTVPELLR